MIVLLLLLVGLVQSTSLRDAASCCVARPLRIYSYQAETINFIA